jgi:hypothetical protein
MANAVIALTMSTIKSRAFVVVTNAFRYQLKNPHQASPTSATLKAAVYNKVNMKHQSLRTKLLNALPDCQTTSVKPFTSLPQ